MVDQKMYSQKFECRKTKHKLCKYVIVVAGGKIY